MGRRWDERPGILCFITESQVYSGEWKDGKFHGHGNLKLRDKQYSGMWKYNMVYWYESLELKWCHS